MLHEFLTSHRAEILDRTRVRVATRASPQPTALEITHGIPLFFDQLIATLGGAVDRGGTISQDASHHGELRQHMGFSVAQVVRDYGDICQVVTQLAIELGARIDAEEFRIFNECLDNAIAEAVTEFGRQRERSIAEEETQRLGFLAHELRDSLHTASLCYEILKSGTVAIGGSTGAVLGRSLATLRALVDRTLAQVRLDAGVEHRERVEIPRLLEEVEAAGLILARDRGLSLSIERGNPEVAVTADRQLLGSAIANLVQNAFKFTREKGHVHVSSCATADRVLIEVEDECGGLLHPGQIEQLFQDFHQDGKDKSGLGLGLAISKRAVETLGGSVRARNIADKGCVFTIDLPRLSE
jgi:signal transduction histidine kinase